MSLTTEPGALVNAFGAGLLMILGLWVASVRPRHRVNLVFAVFSFAYGFRYFLSNLITPDDPLWLPVIIPSYAAEAIATFALVIVGTTFPTRLQNEDRGRLIGSAAAAIVMAGALTAWHVMNLEAFIARAQTTGPVTASTPFGPVFTILRTAGFFFVLFLFATRFPRMERAEDRASLALLSVALFFPVGISAGQSLYSANPITIAQGLSSLLALLVIAGIWIRNIGLVPAQARLARNTALAALAIPLLGMILSRSLLVDSAPGTPVGIAGIARTLAVLAIAYAIVRHQLFDIDMRVKWTIKQSTVAAVFIMVFFVVSETAQRFFESSLGPYIGIFAAGSLVFALAPLQRAAERVANAAMPGVSSSSEYLSFRKLQVYRAAIESAMADGEVTAKEKAMIDTLRAQLEIRPEDAAAIEADVSRAFAKGAVGSSTR